MNKRFATKKGVTKAIVPKLVPYVPSEEYKRTVCANSYIGKKGYTVPKSILDPLDLEILYKDLYMIPVKMGPAFGSPGAEDESAFPVYRENTNKIYLPRFYGIERYGFPVLGKEIDLTKVSTIDCTFDKPLRDYQEEIVDTFVSHIHKNPQHHSSGGIIQIGCGRGKCVAKDTLIIMFDGTTKKVQDIVVGDQIMGDDSTPRNILTLARGRETMYKVCTKRGQGAERTELLSPKQASLAEDFGEGYTVNESHILSLKYETNNGKKRIKNDVLDISVLDYLALLNSSDKDDIDLVENLYGYRVPILFPENPLEIDPYLMGYRIGEDSMKGLLEPKKYDNIPLQYKCNSRKNQLELLAGLIDSVGYYDSDNYYYGIRQKNKKVMDDIMFLARSLGFACCEKPMEDKYRYLIGFYWHIHIYGSGLE
jgi:hypothetical protein